MFLSLHCFIIYLLSLTHRLLICSPLYNILLYSMRVTSFSLAIFFVNTSVSSSILIGQVDHRCQNEGKLFLRFSVPSKLIIINLYSDVLLKSCSGQSCLTIKELTLMFVELYVCISRYLVVVVF